MEQYEARGSAALRELQRVLTREHNVPCRVVFYDNSQNTMPKFTFSLVDLPKKSVREGNCAAFVIPRGREHSFEFNAASALQQLGEQAGFRRLIVVARGRGANYENTAHLEAALSVLLPKLAPRGGNRRQIIPLLSTGSQVEDIEATEVAKGDNWVVEDYQAPHHCSGHHDHSHSHEERPRRRLVFLDTDLTQSEAFLDATNNSIDFGTLACEYQYGFVAALSQIRNVAGMLSGDSTECLNAAIVGVGAGSFPMFLRHRFGQEQLRLHSCDIDEEVVKAARDHFGFAAPCDIEDGVQWTNRHIEQGTLFDVLVVDVNGDAAVGMTFPPADFVSDDIIENTWAKALKPFGALVLNLVCRNEELRTQVLGRLACHFKTMFIYQIPGHVNWTVLLVREPDGTTSDKQSDAALATLLQGSGHEMLHGVHEVRETRTRRSTAKRRKNKKKKKKIESAD
ncbi:MAG: hypothetical protein MHM6MM_007928 [Cercozoa sp. M6MM]